MTTRSPTPLPTADDLLPPAASLAEPREPAQPSLRRRGQGRGRGGRWWVLVISGALILTCLAAIVALFGRVSGREFAPSHLETRSFSFVEIPLLRIQITPIRRTVQNSPLVAYLRTAAIIPRPQGPPANWHVVELKRTAVAPAPGDAKLLTDYLEHRPRIGAVGRDSYWHQWSLAHPKLAAILWPEVQKLANRELYLLIPQLFRFAEQASTAESFADDIHRFLASSYEELILDLRAAGQSELAESFRQEAMSDYPDDPRWQQLR